MGYADCFALLGGVLLCAILAVAMLKKRNRGERCALIQA